MEDTIKAKFLPIAISTLLITGCSSNTSEYDIGETEAWEACLDKYFVGMAGYYKNNEDLFDDAIEACKALTPNKK